MKEDNFGEVLNIQKTFLKELKKRYKSIILSVIGGLIWSLALFYLGKGILFNSVDEFFDDLIFLVIIFPWIALFTWLGSLYTKIRETFWIQVSEKYGWSYSLLKRFSEEKALLFRDGHSKKVLNGMTGVYHDQPFYLFEYEYSIGQGKNKQTFVYTVCEVKFTGTFPHIYLDCKKNWHSNPPRWSDIAKISLPKEFEDKFELFSPKEYEIETLQIFTPDIFFHLIDAGWDHDMEFVDGELVIYRKKRFNSFVELDGELQKIKKFIDILSPCLNRLRLTQIGDISPSLSR